MVEREEMGLEQSRLFKDCLAGAGAAPRGRGRDGLSTLLPCEACDCFGGRHKVLGHAVL